MFRVDDFLFSRDLPADWQAVESSPMHSSINDYPLLGAWTLAGYDVQPFLQVDIHEVRNITKAATQGNPVTKEYVSSYMLSYSTAGATWKFVKVDNIDKVSHVTSRAASTKFVLFVPICTFYNSIKHGRPVIIAFIK